MVCKTSLHFPSVFPNNSRWLNLLSLILLDQWVACWATSRFLKVSGATSVEAPLRRDDGRDDGRVGKWSIIPMYSNSPAVQNLIYRIDPDGSSLFASCWYQVFSRLDKEKKWKGYHTCDVQTPTIRCPNIRFWSDEWDLPWASRGVRAHHKKSYRPGESGESGECICHYHPLSLDSPDIIDIYWHYIHYQFPIMDDKLYYHPLSSIIQIIPDY